MFLIENKASLKITVIFCCNRKLKQKTELIRAPLIPVLVCFTVYLKYERINASTHVLKTMQ